MRMADLSAPDETTSPPALNIGLMSYERVTAEMRKALPGITAEQIQTFIAVVRKGQCSQTEISKATGFTRQAVSRHIAKLVRAGLLVQRRDPESGRRRVVRLAALGRLIPATLNGVSRRAGK
ncbi:hypothetical protein GCM10023165_52930 [Variovorax defluvii]|uniref:MarR family transcriptional regulator n=1 Tax=Variovorax defluvii TaxID=913761 RepID=A0ABP8IGV9_9BURK